jgi:hypothetical protein
MSAFKAIGSVLLIITAHASFVLAEDSGKVTIHVEDILGARIHAYITITNRGTNKVRFFIKSEDQKDASATIPYGRYTLTIESPGFEKYERRFNVLGSATYVRAALKVVEPDERRVIGRHIYPFIRGSVEGALAVKSDLWAKLIPITGTEDNLMDARISKDGRFQFDGMDVGNYLLLILDGNRVIATEPIQSLGNKEVKIRLQ